MAQVAYYQNALKKLMDDPSSFSGTPGYTFARDQALQAVNRGNSAIRGGGAAMTELADRAGSMASGNYLSYLKQLGDLSGQEQQYDLGEVKNANDLTLGNAANANNATKIANDYDISGRGLALDRYKTDQTVGLGRYKADQDYGLGMTKVGADYALGSAQNANTAQRNWWDYDLGRRSDMLGQAHEANTYNLGAGNNAVNMFRAQTERGNGRSASDLDWSKWDTARNPVRRFV